MYDDKEFDLRYVKSRLEKTFLVYPPSDGMIYVEAVRPDKFIEGRTLLKTAVVPLKEVRISSPALGNTDFDGEAMFVSRVPLRDDWRQGLRAKNIVCLKEGRIERSVTFNLFSLAQPIFCKYSKVEEALGKVEDAYKSVAISRNFSVSENYTLVYKCYLPVGSFNNENGLLKVPEKNMWLKELIKEEVNLDVS